VINYILNKIFYGFLTLFGVVTVVFLLFSVLPGDPARMMLDQKEDPEQLAQIRKNLGLDQPLWKQYAFYINDLSPISFHNIDENNTTYTSLSFDKYNYTKLMDFGTNEMVLKTPYLRESFQKQGKSVSTIIGETLPNTMVLAIAAIIIATIIGVALGIVSALMKDTWIDRVLLVVTSFGMSIPSFFSAIIIAYIFAFLMHDITGLNKIFQHQMFSFSQIIHFIQTSNHIKSCNIVHQKCKNIRNDNRRKERRNTHSKTCHNQQNSVNPRIFHQSRNYTQRNTYYCCNNNGSNCQNHCIW